MPNALNSGQKWLSVTRAANRLGISSDTLRRWEREGKIKARRINSRGDRRFSLGELTLLERGAQEERVVLYLRVSGGGDQLSSLANQEEELRQNCQNIVAVYKDIGSGLNEKRRGLARLLKAAEKGQFEVVRVTYLDRLSRFGASFLEDLLAARGVRLEVLHQADKVSGQQELMDDFMRLISSFSGRLYGQRSAQAKRRLQKIAREAKE